MWGVILVLAVAQLPAGEGYRRVYAPRDAAAAAWIDLSQNVPTHRHATQWYLWIPDHLNNKEYRAVCNGAVNQIISTAGQIINPVECAGGRLLRYDLAEIVPRKKDFDRVWAELQRMGGEEPYFHQPRSYTEGEEYKRVAVAPYLASDGKWYDYKYEKIFRYGKTEFGLHAGGAGPLRLLSTQAGDNQLPICRADWFLAAAWNSLTVGGVIGHYYQLAGIGATFDDFLRQVGADPKLVESLRSDQRIVMVSGVTGKWRRVDAFFAVGVRPEDGPSLFTVTRDIKDRDTDARRHPLLNLLEFEDQAREAIAAKRNGLHLFLLTDGKGNRQDSAPDDVAAWANSPHVTKRLSAGISCIECHGANRGYNPTENFVRDLARRGLAPVGDLASRDAYADLLDRLRGLYDGDLELPLKTAANGYALAVDRATGGVFGARSVEGYSSATVKAYNGYFGKIYARQFLAELGYDCEEKEAATLLGKVIPPASDEDGRIGALRLGLPILRSDVHEIYYETALRDALRPDTGAFDPPTEQPPTREPNKQRAPVQPPKPKPASKLVPKGAFGAAEPSRGNDGVPSSPVVADRGGPVAAAEKGGVNDGLESRGPDARFTVAGDRLAMADRRRLEEAERGQGAPRESQSRLPAGHSVDANGSGYQTLPQAGQQRRGIFGRWRTVEPAAAPAKPVTIVPVEPSKATPHPPYRVEYVQDEPGLEIHGPPGAVVYYYSSYGGRINAAGRMWSTTNALTQGGQSWPEYEIWLMANGQWKLAKVDLKPGVRIVVVF